MPTVTEDNVEEYSGYIDSLQSGLSSIKGGALSAGNTDAIKSAYESAEATGWTDNVGVAFNARVKECKNIMDTMTATVNGGAFNQMYSCVVRMQTYADEVKSLKKNKGDYGRWRSNLDDTSESYEKLYNNYTNKINYCNTHIKGNLDALNADMATLPNYHFELSDAASNSESGGGDTGGGDSRGDAGAALPEGMKKNENGMLVVEDYTYTDEFGESHTVTMMIDPSTGNRIVIDGDTAYVMTRDYQTEFQGALAIDGENAYTYDAATLLNGQSPSEFINSSQATQLLANPEASNPYDSQRFAGDALRTDNATGDGETHTVQFGNDSVTFYTSMYGAGDAAFNSYVNSNTNANMFDYD